MQTASAELTTALTSREREPVQRVKVDWGRDGSYVYDLGIFSDTFTDEFVGIGDIGDVSRFVESVTVDRSLSTDLPATSRLDTGYGAAEATIVLAGDLADGIGITRALSAYGASGDVMRRVGAPVTVDVGAVGANGAEYVRQFTGRVRSSSVDPFGGAVTLSALDGREKMRTPVTLPIVAADDFNTVRPGLNAQWLIDYIARANGVYASPPLRSQAIMAATLHGSAWPEVATLTLARTYATIGTAVQGPASFAPGDDGTLGLSSHVATGASYATEATYTPTGGVTTLNAGTTLFFELFNYRIRATNVQANPVALTQGALGTATNGVIISNATFANGVRVTVGRQGASTSVTLGSASLTAGVDHYVGVHVTLTTAGFDAVVCVDGTLYTGSGVVGNPAGNPTLDTVTTFSSGASGQTVSESSQSGVQVTTEAYSASMFNDDFVPTATFEESLNELTGTPISDKTDAWELLQEAASAEQGVILFDENDTLRFYNRDHMSGGAAVATVTASDEAFSNLKAMASSETVDSISNTVTAGAIPVALDPPSTVIWTLTEVVRVPALEQVIIPAQFPGPIYVATSTTYLAALAADGTGGDASNLTITNTRTGLATWDLGVRNPNNFDVFIVANSTAPTIQGQPYMTISGQCIRPALESGYSATRRDTASITNWGDQSLDIGANPWRQSISTTDGLAVYLLSALKDPHATLEGVAIVGDPRLQLGDRVRVVEPDGMALDGEFWVVAINGGVDGSSLSQTVTLRQA